MMVPYTPQREYEVAWTGAMEAAAIKAQQRKPERQPPHAICVSDMVLAHVRACLELYPNSSSRSIQFRTGHSRATVQRALYLLEDRGQIEPLRDDRLHVTVWRVR